MIVLLILYRNILPLSSLKIFNLRLFPKVLLICLGIFCGGHFCYLFPYLVFYGFPGSLVWCLLPNLKILGHYYFKYFLNSVLSSSSLVFQVNIFCTFKNHSQILDTVFCALLLFSILNLLLLYSLGSLCKIQNY